MEAYLTQEFENMCFAISKSQNPSDLLLACLPISYSLKNHMVMCCLSDYQRQVAPKAISQLPKEVKEYIIPYFEHEKIYFINEKLIANLANHQGTQYPIDYSISFDSNFASYIGAVIRGKNLGKKHNIIIKTLDSIIYNDLNFDSLFYSTENIKQTVNILSNKKYNHVNAWEFWKLLDKDFKWNIVALELFKGINCQHYKKTLEPKSIYTFNQAFKNAVKNTFNFYASVEGRKFCNYILYAQRQILLLLIKIVSIQFKSKKKERAKITELLDFMHNEIGIYFDREMIIAGMYYSDRNSVPFLQVVNTGGQQIRLLKKLDNLAWDMISARFLEKFIGNGGEGQFFIPYFLTFDSKLKKLYELYRVKAAIIDKNSQTVVPIPCLNSESFLNKYNIKKEEYNRYFSNEAKKNRSQKIQLNNQQVFNMIKLEYRTLRHTLK